MTRINVHNKLFRFIYLIAVTCVNSDVRLVVHLIFWTLQNRVENQKQIDLFKQFNSLLTTITNLMTRMDIRINKKIKYTHILLSKDYTQTYKI